MDDKQAKKPAVGGFVKLFVPGLAIGLLIGALGGAFLSPYYEASTEMDSGAGLAPPRMRLEAPKNEQANQGSDPRSEPGLAPTGTTGASGSTGATGPSSVPTGSPHP
jgi:hypothetical protein